MKGETQFTVQDFEDKARELSRIMYALTEERFHAAERCKSPVGRTMQESVLSGRVWCQGGSSPPPGTKGQ